LFHFVEGLPHADEADSAAGGVEDSVGVGPAQLLDEFVAHGLLAFDAERLFQGGDVEPAFALRAFGDHAAAVGDESVDQRDVRAVGHAFEVVGHGHIARHEDVGLDSRGGGVGGEGAGGVAGGGRGELLQSIMASHGDGHGHAAGFEAAGGIVGFFFNVEAGIAAAGKHGRPALAEGDGGGVGEDIGVAPHGGLGAAGGAGCGLLQRIEVIADVERSGAGGADGLGSVGGDVLMAAGTLEVGDGGHPYRLQVAGYR
jgi:hypothetical protein